jgi:DNA-binding NtrC family response regulator
VKLLRILQEHTYERVGDNQLHHTNARIVAATHRDLRRAVEQGSFREDLYYRLRVIPIEIPPLRARREDIEPISRLLLSRVGVRTGRALRFSPDALRALLSHDWPGNVRELENALEFAATVCKGQTVQLEDLPPELIAPDPAQRPEPTAASLAPSPLPLVRRGGEPPPDERVAIAAALEANRWNRVAAARSLGMSRSTLWRRMRALGLARSGPPAIPPPWPTSS